MAFAGSIRGAIAFGLAISIQTASVTNDQVLVSTTLILVFVTTILFGAFLPFVIDYYKKIDIQMNVPKAIKDEEFGEYKNINQTEFSTNGFKQENEFNSKSENGHLPCTFEFSYSHPNNRYE